jgi:uncharacterized protein (TIRG00374 family)
MNHSKRWLFAALAMPALGGLLIWSILTNPEWRAFNARLFLQSLVSVDKVWMLWALLAIYASYLVRALRWKVLMSRVKPEASLWNLFSATVIGFGAIGILGRAGEAVRPYLVARKENVPISSQMAIWIIERAFDTLTVLVAVAFALRRIDPAGLHSSPVLSGFLHTSANIVAFSTLALLIAMLGFRNFSAPVIHWLIARLRVLHPSHSIKVEQSLRAFLEGTRCLQSTSTLFACCACTIVQWTLIALCYDAVFRAFSGGIQMSLSELLIFMGAVMGGSLVQIPGVGGGAQVASILVLTEIFAIRPELAASIALSIWVFTFLVVIPPAVLLALYEGLSWSKLRKLESEGA